MCGTKSGLPNVSARFSLRQRRSAQIGRIPTQTELLSCLHAVVNELAEEKISLAIDNSRIPAPELNELLGSIHSPWLGAAVDTANPLALPQGWQISLRVLGHCTLSLQIKDFVVQPEAHGMGFSVMGCPVGNGQLNIAWLVESFASLRIEPSVDCGVLDTRADFPTGNHRLGRRLGPGRCELPPALHTGLNVPM